MTESWIVYNNIYEIYQKKTIYINKNANVNVKLNGNAHKHTNKYQNQHVKQVNTPCIVNTIAQYMNAIKTWK